MSCPWSEMPPRLWQWLDEHCGSDWRRVFASLVASRTSTAAHGKQAVWQAAIESLPRVDAVQAVDGRFVSVDSETPVDDEAVTQSLRQLHPWRKGPFRILGVEIDTEWRSDLKWDRIVDRVSLRGANVLDIGSGNGYYGWRMLDAGAAGVLGIDPTLLFVMQFAAVNRYAQSDRHMVAPVLDTELPRDGGQFDLTFSMGVLYHRTSPIDHLQTIHRTLRRGGTAVIETLVIDDSDETILVPQDRYAQMRNVWMIPSVSMLKLWLRRTGFDNLEVIDDSVTTPQEQRSTPWMTFHSLPQFLDGADPARTVEGYPAPRRAMLTARCV